LAGKHKLNGVYSSGVDRSHDLSALRISPSPSLRFALWLYLLVLLLTIAIVGLVPGEVLLFRLIAAFFALISTAVAIYASRTDWKTVTGHKPTFGELFVSLLMGIALWLPVFWLIFLTNAWMNTAIGPRAAPDPLPTGATRLAVIIQSGIVIPLFQGILFWAFLQKAAQGLGRLRGILLTAVLFGMFGLFSTEFGMSAFPAYFVIGLAASFVAHVTGSAWTGIAAVSGFSLMRPILERTPWERDLFAFLNPPALSPEASLIGTRWLMVVVVSAFFVFMLIQVIRARSRQPEPTPPAAPGRLWWIPLGLSVVLCLVLAYGEIVIRLGLLN
jgi:hypothetical protein